jgi:hypothetical protein
VALNAFCDAPNHVLINEYKPNEGIMVTIFVDNLVVLIKVLIIFFK